MTSELVEGLVLLLPRPAPMHSIRHNILPINGVCVGLLGQTCKVLPALGLNTSLMPLSLQFGSARLSLVGHQRPLLGTTAILGEFLICLKLLGRFFLAAWIFVSHLLGLKITQECIAIELATWLARIGWKSIFIVNGCLPRETIQLLRGIVGATYFLRHAWYSIAERLIYADLLLFIVISMAAVEEIYGGPLARVCMTPERPQLRLFVSHSVVQALNLGVMLDTFRLALILLHLNRLHGLIKLFSHFFQSPFHNLVCCAQISYTLVLWVGGRRIIKIPSLAMQCDYLTFQHRVGLQCLQVFALLPLNSSLQIV